MPELPEVETIARSLEPQIQGHTIVSIEKLDWERMVRCPDVPLFRGLLPGRTIERVGRRAKWLLFFLDEGWTLALHLRMSGRIWVVTYLDVCPDKHTHLVVQLDGGLRLFFRDPRKFGRIQLLDKDGMHALDQSLGLEPLSEDFSLNALAQILAPRRTLLKPLLLNQQLIAGLGNIYVDESLWQAQLHPTRQAWSLNMQEIRSVHTAIQTVLHRAISCGGSTLRDYRDGYGKSGQNQEYFSVYGRTGKSCPRCGTPIERLVVAQRSTHFCPTCQPK